MTTFDSAAPEHERARVDLRAASLQLAVVLVVKGLGRYPELRAAEDGVRTGAAERFIIGTFASVLWACACAGIVVLVR